MQGRSNTDILGIDVSMWQGDINWPRVASAGVRFAYIKATEGIGWQDPKWRQNYEGAKAAGILVGFYQFAHPDNDVDQDVDYFLSVVGGLPVDLPYVLDVEQTKGLGRDAITRFVDAWCTKAQERTGHPVMVYTYTNFARNYLGPELKKWPLWIAEYGVSQPQDNGVWDRWTVWQYTSEGRIDGINGNVDLNVAVSLEALTGGAEPVASAPKPTPPARLVPEPYYTVQYGDTLTEIAQKFGCSVDDLVRWNDIPNPDLIYVGQVLRVVPYPHEKPDSGTYVVQPGDTLSGIAQRFGTTVAELVRLNGIANPDLILVGQVLRLPGHGDVSANSGYITYTVQPGDTLWGISQKYGCTVDELVKLNGIQNRNLIFSGQVLKVPKRR